MQEFPPLSELGRRICVTGPSGAGKSTLAAALGKKLGLPAVYLDQLYHQPGTDWVPRPTEEFTRLHDEAAGGEGWVIDGNYSRLFPLRLERATSVIMLKCGRWSSLRRYVRREWFDMERHGGLAGAKRRVQWSMVRYILVDMPAQAQRREALLRRSAARLVEIGSRRELKRLYRAWGLR